MFMPMTEQRPMIGDDLVFDLPPELAASAPPEARGLARDEVRLMVTDLAADTLTHARFRDLPDFLRPGDLLVINTSGTLNAAVEGQREDGTPVELHLSSRLPADLWIVELRRPAERATRPLLDARPGERIALSGGGRLTIHTPHAPSLRADRRTPVRLWIATLDLPLPLHPYLREHGFPIRYDYVEKPWPTEMYQTVYATEPGSAEMPSAGRAFTPSLITRLVARGVQIAPLLLHTGVASQESGEPPYEEVYHVPAATAAQVTAAHREGRRVIAVGTTVVRALETVTEPSGITHPGRGWTELVITPDRGLRAVTGMLTGLHEPRATHLAMLETLAGRAPLVHAYSAALEKGYLWHEFGDMHLIV